MFGFQRLNWARLPRFGGRRRFGDASAAASGEENPPGTAGGAKGCPVGADVADGTADAGRDARARTDTFGMRGAQAWQTSRSVHTWPMAGLWTRSSMGVPKQDARVFSWNEHSAAPQAHAALGRTVTRRACARTCSAAKRRITAASRDRGGIRQVRLLQAMLTV